MSGTQEQTSFILFTDIYRSSALWEQYPDEFSHALEEHNGIVEEVVQSRGGEIMKNLGDGYIALFDTAAVCVSAMVDVERGMDAVPTLPDETSLQVRLVGHGGPLKRLAVGKGYFGHALNRASRIVQVCHPGQALVSEAVRAHVGEAVDGAKLTDLGSHHLRDLAEPEHLYQLNHPEFALHEFPPLPTLEYRPNNLVFQPNAFIGREREHGELKQIITEKKQRLVTVTAPGGYGKSRLATQLCANLLDHYENGVFEVLLAPVGSHERIVGATADALGFQFYGKAEPREQLIDYLREKQMLVCFDNFEHVMEGKDLLSDILQHAPKVSLLVTSREPLRLKAEKVYRLEPLPTGVGRAESGGTGVSPVIPSATNHGRDGRATDDSPRPATAGKPTEEELPDAVQLFVDRATLVKHDFSLTTGNLATVNDICAKLNGVPLSIELAAAWADSFTLGELLAEVEHQLELTAKMSDVPERQRSIRASLDWSYNLLTDVQREVLRAVSTFKGGFFFEAAESTVGAQHVVPAMMGNGARARHAVPVAGDEVNHGRDARATGTGPRPTEDEYEERILAHASYFANLIEREGERLKGHGQLEALKILGMELENIYEGLDIALNREKPELLLPFAAHLFRYLNIVSAWRDGLSWYERITETAHRIKEVTLEIEALLGTARFLWTFTRYNESTKAASAAEELAEEVGHSHSLARARRQLGLVANAQGRCEEAEKLYRESLEIMCEIGDPYEIAMPLISLANMAIDQGRYEEAEKLQKESLDLLREVGDHWGIAVSIMNLGLIARAQGRYGQSEELNRESLEIYSQIGAQSGIANSVFALGTTAYFQGRYGEAQKLWQESLEIKGGIGDHFGITRGLINLGVVAHLQSRDDKAEQLHLESLQRCREIGPRYLTGCCLANLSSLMTKQGRFADAKQYLKEALLANSDIRARLSKPHALIVCGHLLVMTGRFKESTVLLSGAERQAKVMNHKLGPMEQGELDEARAKLNETLSEKELAEARARAEAMSLEELTDFALKALEGIGDRE